MQVTSILRYARISPQKCRLVADVVRGKPVGNAIATLKFMPKKGAELVRKLLESAVANAETQFAIIRATELNQIKTTVLTKEQQTILADLQQKRADRMQDRINKLSQPTT